MSESFHFVYIQLLELFITTCLFRPLTLLHNPCTDQALCSDGNLNLDTGLDVDDDLLDNLGGSVEVDEAYGRD
jgi:hypothetical protein